MKISLYPPLSIHEIGRRDNQEDALAQLDNHLFVLCDGMGGHEKGEVASQTVCQAIVKWFEENITDDNFTDDLLRAAIEYAYTELDKFDDGNLKKMGTTLTLLYIHNKGITAAHMGDSRIYHIRPNIGVLYQSRDHSLVFDLFQAGEITYEEMGSFEQKNIVTRAMTPGEDNRMRPDIIHIADIKPSDYFYMCSDGMLEQMNNNELTSLLFSNETDEEKRQQLIATTVNNQDNHSAWLIHIKDVIKEEGDEALVNEEPIARCNAINILPTQDTEAKIADEDDVVIVSSPKSTNSKFSLLKIVVLVALLVFFIVWLFFLRSEEKSELQRPKPMMQTPIRPHHNKNTVKDSFIKDTNHINRHESRDK